MVIDLIENKHDTKVELIADFWLRQKLKLFGHILRPDRADPLKRFIFDHGTIFPHSIFGNKKGRPKLDWTKEAFKESFDFSTSPKMNKICITKTYYLKYTTGRIKGFPLPS